MGSWKLTLNFVDLYKEIDFVTNSTIDCAMIIVCYKVFKEDH